MNIINKSVESAKSKEQATSVTAGALSDIDQVVTNTGVDSASQEKSLTGYPALKEKMQESAVTAAFTAEDIGKIRETVLNGLDGKTDTETIVSEMAQAIIDFLDIIRSSGCKPSGEEHLRHENPERI